MGPDRALIAVALQGLLMAGVRDYRDRPAVGAHSHRLLATAASLDYVLMLARDSAGTRIAPDDARRAMHDGFARAVDDALVLLRAVADDPAARAYVHEGLTVIRAAVDVERLADDRRSFALIALAADVDA